MTSKYRDRTGEVVTQDGKEPIPPQPCTFCGRSTPHATLANYGARCFACFEAYCEKGLKGATHGFTDGRRDTPQQTAMRAALKANRPTFAEAA